MKEEKLREIYFKFYDELEEPCRTQAKKNWDYSWASKRDVPIDIYSSVMNGFRWECSIEGLVYWTKLSRSLFLSKQNAKGSYFEEITQGICELLTEKDKRYGSFIDTPLEIFEGKCVSGRDIDKKLSRIKNADHLRLNDVADIIGYLILAMREKKWTKEDILKLID